MYKYIALILFIFMLAGIFFSCNNNNEQNLIVNQNANDLNLDAKIKGLWKLSNNSENGDNKIDYYFDSHNFCYLYLGTSDKILEQKFCTYKINRYKGITKIMIFDKQDVETVIRVINIDDTKMNVIFEVKNNTEQTDNSEVELIKYNPLES